MVVVWLCEEDELDLIFYNPSTIENGNPILKPASNNDNSEESNRSEPVVERE
jgi:hypothetical protein